MTVQAPRSRERGMPFDLEQPTVSLNQLTVEKLLVDSRLAQLQTLNSSGT
jgi:hypothetical protein